MDSQTLMLIILVIVLIFVYKVMSSVGMKKMADQESEIEEYFAQKMFVKVYFNRGKKQAFADLDGFEKTGEVRVTLFTTDAPKNEVERQMEGKWGDAGTAIVRVKKGTNEIVSWTIVK